MKKSYKKNLSKSADSKFPSQKQNKKSRKSSPQKQNTKKNVKPSTSSDNSLIRLNKFIAHSGIASRRKADELIKAGFITVNGKKITQLGYKIKPTDDVRYKGKRLTGERPVYIVMNKPKDVITSVYDPQGRRTVIDLLQGKVKERVYPVGRLDRNTTGVLLLTNDGELTKILTHPSSNIPKVYVATLDRPLKKRDLQRLVDGIELEDGFAYADQAAYIDKDDRKKIGIEIHSGKNHIVRRLFKAMGYKVVKLDRIKFAFLDKKDLPRGQWRFLTQKEIGFLKMLAGQQQQNKKQKNNN
jgi:23S rRNA pseudouridine2605 synthase